MDRPLENAVTKASDLLENLRATQRSLFWVPDAIKQEWKEEVDTLSAFVLPSTSIAICGATGSGKSTLFNALLGKNIMPTSGAQACTAVAIEVSWHDSPSIAAEICFMEEAAWHEELEIFLEDVNRSYDDDSSAQTGHVRGDGFEGEGDAVNVTWQKVQACYPSLGKSELSDKSVEDILASNTDLRALLGTSVDIEKETPEEFLSALSRYVESTTQNRYHHPEPNAEYSICRPSLWPLVHLVKIRCNSDVLRTGAILVDLPGSADSNAARVRVMKDYLRRCDRIFLAAACIRATDCKVAKDLLGDTFKAQLLMDGMYDDKTITFIVTKCDDISCNEAARGFYNDALFDKAGWDQLCKQSSNAKGELNRLRKDQEVLKRQRSGLKAQLKSASRVSDALRQELEEARTNTLAEHAQLRSLKRPSNVGAEPRKKLKRHGAEFDPSSFEGEYPDESEGSERDKAKSEDESDMENTSSRVINLQLRVNEARNAEQNLSQDLWDIQQQFEDAANRIEELEALVIPLQRQMNAFCSLYRSQNFQFQLKYQFRAGLNEIQDEARHMQGEGATSTKPKRDLSNANVPVFTVSARDYMRITNQIENDGDPVCFNDVDGTQIEQVRTWCHTLTESFRLPTARSFLDRISNLIRFMSTFADNDSDNSELDRNELQLTWTSTIVSTEVGSKLARIAASMNKLITDELEDEVARDFKNGVTKAAESAVATVEAHRHTVHWSTYRATLRKKGEHESRSGDYYDLNLMLLNPLILSTMDSWTDVVCTDFYDPLRLPTMSLVDEVLQTFQDSIARPLHPQANRQITTCKKAVRMLVDSVIDKIRGIIEKERKGISRLLEPLVKDKLTPGYLSTVTISGKGSVQKQADAFNDFIDLHMAETFDELNNSTEARLESLKTEIGKILDGVVDALTSKMERTMCAMWQAQGRKIERVRAQGELGRMAKDITGFIDGLSD